MRNEWLRISVIVLILSIIAGCKGNSEHKRLISEVERLEASLFGDTTAMPDRTLAMETIQAYENFANAMPDDTLSAEYLYKGAELAMNLQMPAKAIEFHQRILNNYPDFDKASYSLFLEAFIYENQMQQYENAKKLYNQFIEMYPDHPLTDDAEVSLQNMGKSIEELIESWENQIGK